MNNSDPDKFEWNPGEPFKPGLEKTWALAFGFFQIKSHSEKTHPKILWVLLEK